MFFSVSSHLSRLPIFTGTIKLYIFLYMSCVLWTSPLNYYEIAICIIYKMGIWLLIWIKRPKPWHNWSSFRMRENTWNEVEEFSNINITEFYEAKGADACARDKNHGLSDFVLILSSLWWKCGTIKCWWIFWYRAQVIQFMVLEGTC